MQEVRSDAPGRRKVLSDVRRAGGCVSERRTAQTPARLTRAGVCVIIAALCFFGQPEQKICGHAEYAGQKRQLS